MAAEGVMEQRKIPRGLGTFREKEAKALAASLVMCGIMLLMAVIPITTVSDSSLVRTGVPIVTALMFTLSGTLTIVTEQRPQRLLGLSATAVLLLSAGTGAAETVVGLVDIGRLREVPGPCNYWSDYMNCVRRNTGQATLISSMPAVCLLTLYGTLLCIVLSTLFFELLHNWAPASDGASGIDPPQEGGGFRAAEPSRHVVRGEKFLESEPKLLGVILLTVSFGLVLLSTPDLVLKRIEMARLGMVWWSFVHSVVSGLLAIVAAENPSRALIRSCFTLTVLSAIVSSIVSIAYLELNSSIIICLSDGCQDSIIFAQHVFPFLLLLLSTVLCSVLAAYARKDLRPLSLNNATLIVNPTPAQEQREHPSLHE